MRRPVVVLAEKDKEDMDKQLRTAMRGHNMAWHTRMGAPHNLNDLHRVAAGQARTIILLEPENGEVCAYVRSLRHVCACMHRCSHTCSGYLKAYTPPLMHLKKKLTK